MWQTWFCFGTFLSGQSSHQWSCRVCVGGCDEYCARLLRWLRDVVVFNIVGGRVVKW